MTPRTALDRIRLALNRTGGVVPPPPPLVYEPTARLVYSDLGLPELFAHAAARGGMSAKLVHVEELLDAVVGHLNEQGVAEVAMAPSPLLKKVRLAGGLASAGVRVVDGAGPGRALVTGCDAAVAETGSLVFRGTVPAGWHAAAARVAILEPKNLVPDLIDLLATSPGERTLVSGPAAVAAFVLY